MLKDEGDEMKRAANRYHEELHQRKKELKEASELLAGCQKSLLTAEKEKERVGREADRTRADFEQAKALILEKDRALQVTARVQDSLKAEMAAKVAKANVEAV